MIEKLRISKHNIKKGADLFYHCKFFRAVFYILLSIVYDIKYVLFILYLIIVISFFPNNIILNKSLLMCIINKDDNIHKYRSSKKLDLYLN